ncbi:MAG: lactate racemase domain-containing protein [Acidobacteriota bacterium]
MINNRSIEVFGKGDSQSKLSLRDLRGIVEAALSEIPKGARVLAIIPDKTRDDITHLLIPLVAKALMTKEVADFDALVAQGTHGSMTHEEKCLKVGGTHGSLPSGLSHIYDHRWDHPDDLVIVGTLTAERVEELTDGLLKTEIPLSINFRLAKGVYDVVLIIGGTVPHEVVGFAGGAKYFFPGVSGPELTHATHWLGALVTIEKTIGRIETPTRRLIEASADFITPPIISFTSVSTRSEHNELRTHALFAGDYRAAFRKAAEVSKSVHIKYVTKKYARVVAMLDDHYEDLWVGGKASYKLGGILENGGELVIYAPHLRSISETHGELIARFGYAPLEVILEQLAESVELQNNLCVAAHLTHVSYGSRKDARGKIQPKYRITLATQIGAEVCAKINLNYLDPTKFSIADYASDENTLIVEKAGRDLYLLK